MRSLGKLACHALAAVAIACCAVQAANAQKAPQTALADAANGSLLGVDPPPGMDPREHTRRLVQELDVGGLTERMPAMAEFFAFGNGVVLPNVYGRGGLDFHDRELVVMATIIAQSTPLGLDWHFRDLAWKAGISEREVQEVIYTACLYGGWPKCATANNEFRRILDGPNNWPKELRVGTWKAKTTPATPGSLLGIDPPPGMDPREHTRRLVQELDVGGLTERMPKMAEFFEFGNGIVLPNLYGRGGLDFHDRELVVIATIIAQSTPLGLNWHFRDLAWKAGISEREVQEVIYTACLYGGWPKCATANNEFRKALDGPNNWPKELRMHSSGK